MLLSGILLVIRQGEKYRIRCLIGFYFYIVSQDNTLFKTVIYFKVFWRLYLYRLMTDQPHKVSPPVAAGPFYEYFNNRSNTITFFGHRKLEMSVHSIMFRNSPPFVAVFSGYSRPCSCVWSHELFYYVCGLPASGICFACLLRSQKEAVSLGLAQLQPWMTSLGIYGNVNYVVKCRMSGHSQSTVGTNET